MHKIIKSIKSKNIYKIGIVLILCHLCFHFNSAFSETFNSRDFQEMYGNAIAMETFYKQVDMAIKQKNKIALISIEAFQGPDISCETEIERDAQANDYETYAGRYALYAGADAGVICLYKSFSFKPELGATSTYKLPKFEYTDALFGYRMKFLEKMELTIGYYFQNYPLFEDGEDEDRQITNLIKTGDGERKEVFFHYVYGQFNFGTFYDDSHELRKLLSYYTLDGFSFGEFGFGANYYHSEMSDEKELSPNFSFSFKDLLRFETYFSSDINFNEIEFSHASLSLDFDFFHKIIKMGIGASYTTYLDAGTGFNLEFDFPFFTDPKYRWISFIVKTSYNYHDDLLFLPIKDSFFIGGAFRGSL